MPRLLNYFRLLSLFVVVLFGFLTLAALWLSSQQRNMLKTTTYDEAAHDLGIMADMSAEALLKSDYVTVQTFVGRWGADHPEYHEIRFVAQNGYVLAESIRPGRDRSQTFALSKTIMIGQTQLATASLLGDYSHAETVATELRYRLLLGAFFVTSLLGSVLWLMIKRMALEPLEFQVKERTNALVETNALLTQEIADRNAVQDTLQQREERISLLLNSIAEGIYGVDLQGDCTFCNPAGLRLLGYESPEALIGKNIHALIHHTHHDGESHTDAECKVYRCCREMSGCHVEDEVFWRADGTCFAVEYWAQPIMKEGLAVGAVTAFIDISRRKKNEEALLQSARDWQETFDSINDAVWILDSEQRILRSNKTAERMFHLPISEMLGKHCWEIVHGTTAPILHCPTCKVKNSLHRETMELQDGATWSQVTVDPILSREGQCLKYIHTVSDISERRKLEEQLRQGQKMEAIGTLAGGIAHDFNNILNVIIGYTELALLECSEPEMVREHLAEVAKGSERARLLVKQILAFGRKSEHTSHPLQIAQVVKEAITMLRASIPSTIEIKQQLLSDGTIDADPTQIHQVVMNLCTNAYHAMRETGGVLTVVVDEVEIGLDEPNIADLSAGRYLRLTVSDTGGGIDPTVLDKIFEPYFTTKGPGEGSGLGLAVVHGIVKGYNGQIAVTSVPGTGTSFRISLPLTQKAVLPLASETETAIVMGGGKRILFVDDEAQLCSLIGIICAEHGYRASTFCWPLQALEEFEKDPQKFDLVITDMTMPQLNGTEFSRKILALRPDIPIILCTGYSTLIDSEKAAEVGISAYLVKPVTPQQLLMVVQQLLAKQITA